VADTSRIHATPDWTPQFSDLDPSRLACEEKLFQERKGETRREGSA